MSSHSSSAEVRARKVAAMGEALGNIHCDLWNELAWLYSKWEHYNALFGTSEERINTMNEVAPRCIYVLQSALWRDILLSLCRMTDPAQSAGKPNVSLQAMLPHIADPALRAQVERAASQATGLTSFARERRNRFFAHSDLLTARNEHPTPLPEASRIAVSGAMRAISEVLNIVQAKYEDSTCIYDFPDGSCDAERLFKAIDFYATDQRRKRQKRQDELDGLVGDA